MKTPEQIKEWLEKQEWYPQFVENMINLRETPYDLILAGEEGFNTIISSFMWCLTSEGTDFWTKVDEKFRDWFEKD